MPSLSVDGHTIPEAVHLIRNTQRQLAHMKKLIRAIELDVQQGHLLNLKALIQLVQQLCENISDDLDQQIEQCQPPLEVLRGIEGSGSYPLSSHPLEPIAFQHDHIGWLVALTSALRGDVQHH